MFMDRVERLMLGIIVAFIVVVVGVLFWIGLTYEDKELVAFTERCTAQGGEVHKDTDTYTSTSFTTKGQPVFTTTTTREYLCRGEDGTVLEVMS